MAEQVVKLSIGGREVTVDLHDPDAAAQTLGMLCDKDTAVARNEQAHWPKPKPVWKHAGHDYWWNGGGWGGSDGGGGGSYGGGWGGGDGGGSCGGDGGGGCGGH